MATDKIRKYVLPNIPYLFIGWFCLKIGTAYRLAAGYFRCRNSLVFWESVSRVLMNS